MVPVPSSHEFLYHKTTIREVYDDARARFPGAPDVLLFNEVGELTETTIGNLVIELDGAL
ncbi:MAG TPA: aminotransferase, partial [Acidimicrobiaceae bacterium]|nr:aminotransferase [Acidimicrobiaceae bacterium]